MRHVESRIQQSCVTWFRMQYPSIGRLLFAVPNGGSRNAREAGIMKGEGVTAGVSDMILLYPCSGYNCLCIEFKTEAKDSKQSPYQKEWQELTERAGNKYIICRSFDDFHREIKEYFKGLNHLIEWPSVEDIINKYEGKIGKSDTKQVINHKDEIANLKEVPVLIPRKKR